MDYESVETVWWLLAILALCVAGGMLWGWIGSLFMFGGISLAWILIKQIVKAI